MVKKYMERREKKFLKTSGFRSEEQIRAIIKEKSVQCRLLEEGNEGIYCLIMQIK